jgi:putative ABC transport system permease protein
MQVAWRLAINSLSQRRNRTALLACSVALCAALISAIACAMASLTAAVQLRVDEAVGTTDARIERRGSMDRLLPQAMVSEVAGWPGVEAAMGRLELAAQLRGPGAPPPPTPGPPPRPRTPGAPSPVADLLGLTRAGAPADVGGESERGITRAAVVGLDPQLEQRVRPQPVLRGRWLSGADAGTAGDGAPAGIVIEENLARILEADVGSDIWVIGGGAPTALRVVGVVRQPSLSVIFDQHRAYVPLPVAQRLENAGERISQIDVVLQRGTDPEAWERERQRALDTAAAETGEPRATLQLTSRITGGLQNNVRSNQIGFIIASVLAFLASAFIITTGLTTSVTERTRELSIIRCVGGTRRQLALAQVLIGGLVGLLGGAVGVPLGVIGSAALVALFPEQLPAGFAFSWLGLAMGLGGAVGAGIVGGVWPAVAATRVSPLEGLSVRSRRVHPRWFHVCLFGGAAALLTHGLIVALRFDPDVKFWVYVLLGIPCIVAGYFMLSVPVTAVVARLAGRALSRGLGLPARVLERTVESTPYRHGFTAGAMMLGLALMVSIWTNGRSVMSDWLEKLEIPDAFAVGLGFTDRTLESIRRVEGVRDVTPISLLTVRLPEAQSMGVAGLQRYYTSFIGFEPDQFFSLTSVRWADPTTPEGIERARRRLREGGAVLVAREFMVTRGVRTGDRLTITNSDRTHEFEVVGVVYSPGLDIVSKFFQVGENFAEQSVNSVFGTRADLRERFGYSAWQLAQIAFEPGVRDGAPGARTPDQVLADVRGLMGRGVREVGSAVEIKARIGEVMNGALIVASVVSVGAMLVACFAVANLIIAGVQARQFEFGVLRAVGAHRDTLGRLVIGEAVIIAVAACILGVAMGTQGAWGGQALNAIVIGIELSVRPPPGPVAVGCLAVVLITVLASWPTAWRLTRRHPRELLAATRG